jgi:hypothetical protein
MKPQETLKITLDSITGLDKFNITYSQRNDCIMLYNFYGREAAHEQAKLFEIKNENENN